jgi:predicted amidophosphoribosyltransferase
MNPLLAFVLVLVALTVITCVAMLFRFRPHRHCPRCRSLVDTTRWRCKYCGYKFVEQVNLHSQ